MFSTSIRKAMVAGLVAVMALPLAAPQAMAGSRHRDDNHRRPYEHYCADRGDVAAGTIIGAVAGGVIGNQFGRGRGRTVATIAGVLLGGALGNRIADDRRCNNYYQRDAYYEAFEYDDGDHRTRWDNPYSDDYGYIEARDTYRDDHGRTCREFTQTIFVEGRRETATGVACRRSDGTWRIIDDGTGYNESAYDDSAYYDEDDYDDGYRRRR